MLVEVQFSRRLIHKDGGWCLEGTPHTVWDTTILGKPLHYGKTSSIVTFKDVTKCVVHPVGNLVLTWKGDEIQGMYPLQFIIFHEIQKG